MSLRTCSWLLPQNEQRYGTLVLLLPVVVLTGISPSALFLLRRRSRLLGRLGDAREACALAAAEPGVVRLGDQRRAGHRVHRIDDAIVLRLLRGHEAVPIGVLFDSLERLAGVAGEDLVVHPHQELPLLH